MESAAPFTLLAVAAGYLFTKLTHLTSFRIQRLSGYHLLFESAIWGIALVGASHTLLSWIGRGDASWIVGIREIWHGHVGVSGLATFALALVLSVLLPYLVNLVYRRERAVRRTIQLYGPELERLLYRAIQRIFPVSVTLKNEKVYIGWPVWTPEPSGETRDLAILPAFSGYRDPRTKQLTLSTQYLPIYDRILEGALEMGADDFQIVLPLEEIRTANFFSLDLDQSFFEIPGDTM